MKEIVIIENDREILEIMEYILIEQGYNVIAVLNETDLLSIVKPDLILLDNWLNGRSGHDICIELKQDLATSAIPVILISAGNNLDEVAKSCQADSYINKPFDIEDLITEVNKHLD